MRRLNDTIDRGYKVNAIISTPAPNLLLEWARDLDDERKAGKTRSEIHSIPIIVKVLVL